MKKQRHMKITTRRKWEGALFIFPWIIGFLIFWAFPLGSSLGISFSQATLTDIFGGNFVGMDNYLKVIGDVYFGTYFIGSLTTAAIDIPIIVIFSLFIAVLLNREMVGRSFFRSVFFLPVIISGAIMKSMMGIDATDLGFSEMFSQGLGSLVSLLGEDVIDRLGIILWQSSVQILIFLAGLQTITPSMYEAAKIDGASAWESFWKITIPQISPMILLNIIYSIIDSFTNSSNQVIELLKSSMFEKLDFGFAAALSWLYFAIILLIILVIFLLYLWITADRSVRKRNEI